MPISHWADAGAQAAYEHAYDDSLGLWPIPLESRLLQTAFGQTHVLVSGAVGGEAVVLIHAASISAMQWYPQAEALGARFRLYSLDIMGDIGRSTQRALVHSRADAAAWLAGALDALGLDRAVLIGSSFGGFLATNLAVQQPHRVAALALLAPAATVLPFRTAARLMIRAGSLIPMPFTVKPGLRGMMGGELPDPRIVRQMEVGVAGFRYDRKGIFPSEIPDDELRAVSCPTLLILGDQERIYDPVSAIDRARRLLPHVETELLSNAGHLPGLQVPERVNDRILEFLARFSSAGAEASTPVATSTMPLVEAAPSA
jgi:pimeloyl-ACP methyl ester carboxylesterase